MPEPNWRSNAARVTPSDSCPDLVESAAGANVLYSCTVSILMVQLYKYNTFDMYRNRHYTTPWSSLQAVNEFLISPNVFGQIWIQKYFGGQTGTKCTGCTQMYTSAIWWMLIGCTTTLLVKKWMYSRHLRIQNLLVNILDSVLFTTCGLNILPFAGTAVRKAK